LLNEKIQLSSLEVTHFVAWPYKLFGFVDSSVSHSTIRTHSCRIHFSHFPAIIRETSVATNKRGPPGRLFWSPFAFLNSSFPFSSCGIRMVAWPLLCHDSMKSNIKFTIKREKSEHVGWVITNKPKWPTWTPSHFRLCLFVDCGLNISYCYASI
jgi:hypothetical protein